jgi:hypothetical protein
MAAGGGLRGGKSKRQAAATSPGPQTAIDRQIDIAMQWAEQQDVNALLRVGTVLKATTLSKRVCDKILRLLAENSSYGEIAATSLNHVMAGESLHLAKRRTDSLSREIATIIRNRPPEIASLRARMLAESLDAKHRRLHTFREMLRSVTDGYEQARFVWIAATTKRGRTVQNTKRQMDALLLDPYPSNRERAKMAQLILSAWNPRLAPKTRESARISIQQRIQKASKAPA